MRDKERAIVATFIAEENGVYRLNSVMTQHGDRPGHSTYDVDYSKSYGYIYHCSGGGWLAPFKVDGVYWSITPESVTEKPCQWATEGPGAQAFRERNATRRLEAIPWDLDGAEDILGWLDRNALQDETVYCSTCEDHLPSESLCEHCWFCDSVGDYKSPGEDNYKPCFDPDCWECHKRRALDKLHPVS